MAINMNGLRIGSFVENHPIAAKISAFAIGLSYNTILGAVTCVVLSNPIGATGGAIYGASFAFGNHIATKAFDKFLGLNNPQMPDSAILKIVAVAASFFAGIDIAMSTLIYSGFPITFKATVMLFMSNLLMAIPITFTLGFGALALISIGSSTVHGCHQLGKAVLDRIEAAQDAAAEHAAQVAAQEIPGGAPVAI